MRHLPFSHFTQSNSPNFLRTLTDIAKSVALYLHDEASPHRILAIELCSSGFHVWQHYVDSVNALRALFDLATAGKGEGIQARAAVLQIATSNTPLFMTTLSMDIANPGSVERKKSVMQLIAYLIKKVCLYVVESWNPC